jgi:intein/homing endonuclease
MLELYGGVGAGGYDLCMVPETSVSGPDRTKNIADLQPGDHVWSWMDGELQARPVVAAWRSKDQEVSRVRTRGRTTVASGSCLFLRVVETARKTTHREAAAWAGLPPGRVPYGSRKDAACSVSGCPDRVDARGMCPRHFRRWQVHGDPRIYETTATIFGYEWARLDQLKVGDLLVTLDGAPNTGTVETLPDGTDVTGDVAWLLGVILGDGTITDKNIRVCVYGETCEQVRRVTAETWGAYSAAEHPDYGTILYSAHLANLLADMGMRRLGPDKRVPDAVWSWPRKLQLAFLDGYRDADGHTPKNTKRHGERSYASSSRQLIGDVRMLHLLAGHHISNLSETKRRSPIIIRGVQVKHPRTLYTFAVWPAGRGGLSRIRAHPGLDRLLPSGSAFGFRRVLSVDQVGVREIWDIEVEDAHNFVADGIVVHSSGLLGAVQGKLWSDDLLSARHHGGCAAPTVPAPPDPLLQDRDNRPGSGWHQNQDLTVSADYAMARVPSQSGAVGLGEHDCRIPGYVLIPGPDGAKRIDEITAGDLVWSFADGRLEAHRVVAALQSIRQPTFRVRTRNRTVDASANHPFLRVGRLQDDRLVSSEREWVRLDQLRRGDLVVSLQVAPDTGRNETLPDGTAVTEDLAWLIGVVTRGGHLTEDGVRLAVHGDMRSRAVKILQEITGKPRIYANDSTLIVNSRRLRRSLEAMGLRVLAHDKRVPSEVWSWPRKLQAAFLDGFCDKNRHPPKGDPLRYGERVYRSASRQLLAEVRMLHILHGHRVGNLGIADHRRKPITINRVRVVNARPLWSFTVFPDASASYVRPKLSKYRALGADDWDAGFAIQRVLEITPFGEQDTWDLNVEDGHNFVADGIVVHSSGPVAALPGA